MPIGQLCIFFGALSSPGLRPSSSGGSSFCCWVAGALGRAGRRTLLAHTTTNTCSRSLHVLQVCCFETRSSLRVQGTWFSFCCSCLGHRIIPAREGFCFLLRVYGFGSLRSSKSLIHSELTVTGAARSTCPGRALKGRCCLRQLSCALVQHQPRHCRGSSLMLRSVSLTRMAALGTTTVLTTVALQSVLQLESARPPILFSFFKIILPILGPFCFHLNFSINVAISTKKPAGIVTQIAWKRVGQFGDLSDTVVYPRTQAVSR